ncbi:MAG: hypothetical protein IPN90_02550 [Elusimicrobia bacterium]|nr:hypothetical protein [Elusimicrobiota bacterium]
MTSAIPVSSFDAVKTKDMSLVLVRMEEGGKFAILAPVVADEEDAQNLEEKQ